MPKTLVYQGFSGLREEVVRSEGRPSCTSVQQALILPVFQSHLPTKHRKSEDFRCFFHMYQYDALWPNPSGFDLFYWNFCENKWTSGLWEIYLC